MSQTEQLSRWRLILGSETEQSFSGMGGVGLSREELLMDAALGAIYGGPGESFGGSGGGGGKGPSSPLISKWLGDLRSLFDPETVAVVQNDAIERKGLKQLLLEPELLDTLEPDLNLPPPCSCSRTRSPRSPRSRPGPSSVRLWRRSTGCWRTTCAVR